jgi:SAM-dependent methyltransferase
MRKALKTVAKVELLKLDLGCGKNKQQGFHGVDIIKFDGVDTILDLGSSPWPWDDGSVGEVYCSHFLEHLDAPQRIHFFNELYRVLTKDGKAQIIIPHWRSGRAYADLTHKWPPVVEFFWYYLDKNWRAVNAPHLDLNCDFNCTWGYSLAHPWNLKNTEAQGFALQHYSEVAQDMVCTAVKRGEVVKQ